MADLSGGEFLSDLAQKDSRLWACLTKLYTGVNTLAKNVAASPVGNVATPTPVDSVSAVASGEILHISLTHNAPLNRGINYFTEIATNPKFSAPMIYHHGTSRTPPPISLPSKDGSGNTQSYYIRSYCQYPGSRPSTPTVFGGASSPTTITMGGSTQLTLLSGQGSGTATQQGTQGGQGFGKFATRGAISK